MPSASRPTFLRHFGRALAPRRQPDLADMGTAFALDEAMDGGLGAESLPPEEANLRTIATLRERYAVPVGYSGHERGLQISLAAVALGAVAVERHITLDRTLWGSDHSASLEPSGLSTLVRDIRVLQDALGDGVKRVFPGELAPRERLRRTTA